MVYGSNTTYSGKFVRGYCLSLIVENYFFSFSTNTCAFLVEHLRSNSTYEFRVFANLRGCISQPSPVSEIIQLRPTARSDNMGYTVPSKPKPPEYANFKGGDRVTLCWYPAESSLPIQVCLLQSAFFFFFFFAFKL